MKSILKNLAVSLRQVNWRKTSIIYGIGLLLTHTLLSLPNFLSKVSILIFDFKVPFNWNHGIALLITTIIGYKFFTVQKMTTLFGTNKIKSIIFSLFLLIGYSVVGISNKYKIDIHLWGFLFVFLTLIYDVFEESFWRGYLNDLINPKYLFVKYIITGILWSLWHLLIFDNFNQWGGFHIFLILSVFVSFLIGYATTKTNSILVASSIHALLISKNIYVTIICLIIWTILIITWNSKTAYSSTYKKLLRL